MSLKLTFLGAALALLALFAVAQQSVVQSSPDGPGFDCQRARARVEKSLCANPELLALDRRVTQLFALALSHAQDSGDIKRAQRRWLRERDACDTDTCMQSRYEERIAALETFTGRLPLTLARTLCARLETPATRAETLGRKSGSEDINNDGIPDTATTCAGGTANTPCAVYVDANKRPLLIQPQGFEGHTYAPLGRSTFRYENRTFVYYSRDAALTEPSHLSYVTPTNREFRICEFTTQAGSAVAEGGADVCAAVESGERIEPIEMTNVTPQNAPRVDRADTTARSFAAVDIDNDGLDDELIELSYDSGGGQGCSFNYFELLTDDRRSLLETSKSAPIRELQGVPPGGYRGRNCGRVQNRLFRFDGKIYYETNFANNGLVPHELRVLDGTAVAPVCTFERQVTTSVSRLFVE